MAGTRRPSLPSAVAPTDFAWFRSFSAPNQTVIQDEVNFWRPGQAGIASLSPGDPFFFKLKSPYNAIAGFGFYSETVRLPLKITWELFGTKNGVGSLGQLSETITRYREKNGAATERDLPLVSILLRNAVFLPEQAWLPWGIPEGWQPNSVQYRLYDLADGPNKRLFEFMQLAEALRPADLDVGFKIPRDDLRRWIETPLVSRIGQSTFRARLLNSYGRCAVSGEHSLPTLDAAHITPYLGPQSNHPQNGLVLRSDIHRLFDAGYVSVTPALRFQVSKRLQDEFDNGRVYYDMAGRELHLPKKDTHLPSREALAWHMEQVFLR